MTNQSDSGGVKYAIHIYTPPYNSSHSYKQESYYELIPPLIISGITYRYVNLVQWDETHYNIYNVPEEADNPALAAWAQPTELEGLEKMSQLLELKDQEDKPSLEEAFNLIGYTTVIPEPIKHNEYDNILL